MATGEDWKQEVGEFARQLGGYLGGYLRTWFVQFERGKTWISAGLYAKRGRYAQPFLHSAMMALVFFGLILGPRFVRDNIAGEAAATDAVGGVGVGEILGMSLDATGIVTLESDKPRDSVVEYVVREGDTLSNIAEKFGVSIDSIKWVNEGVNWQRIKPGDKVKVPPVSGVVYKVRPGDTIYSIAEKFEANAQAIVDFPFNTFANDETFAIVAGQTLIIPDGVMPAAVSAPRTATVLTPDAGSVTATGSFGWPATGRLTQPYRWYHRGIDIANKEGGAILAADAGTVVVAGWTNVGYGNHVIVEHGNGYQTLYAHMSSLAVVQGQRVARGAVLGQMGSTGRSTGTHLHFEIRTASGNVDPMGYLR